MEEKSNGCSKMTVYEVRQLNEVTWQRTLALGTVRALKLLTANELTLLLS